MVDEQRQYPHIGDEGHTEKALREVHRTPNQSLHLRAGGNLSYLDFIRVVESLWKEAHPDIPIIPSHPGVEAKYPCIVYSCMLRRTHPSEPKPRRRESINTGMMVIDEEGEIVANNQGLIISGWRFQNLVKFTAVDKADYNGAQTVDELIEVFEDFMHEYTATFKFLGASEFRYNQRMADDVDDRAGEDVTKRSVTWWLTTEKIFHTSLDKIRSIASTIRINHGLEEATPTDPSPYEPFYEEVVDSPDNSLVRGIFERVTIINDFQTDDE